MGHKHVRLLAVASIVAAIPLQTPPLSAQPLTHRTPNIEGAWVTSPWNLHFAFNHRFRVLGEDALVGDIFDKGVVDNSPTFNLALGVWSPAMVGVKYASSPAIANPPRSNEWFPYVKVAPWRTDTWSVALLGGYNTQAESFDGELSGQIAFGRLELFGAARGFSDALHTDEAGAALAGGLGIRLTNFIVLAGDVGGFVAGPDTTVAWSAGLQLAIPFTPHTFSLQASNASATTPQEASFAGVDVFGGDITWGFEFTVPFSGFARWGRIFDNDRDDQATQAGQVVEPSRLVEIDIREFAFRADTVRIPVGSSIRWVNRDAIAHSSSSDDAVWESPLIGPGETYTTQFDAVGTFAYHCEPHPFMRGVVIVEEND